jgi:Fe-S cluster assembly iron-binding protein IscA
LDSPILLSLAYKDGYNVEYPSSLYNDTFDQMVLNVFNQYNNINIFLERPDNFQDDGRFQDKEQSLMFDSKIKSILDNNSIDYRTLQVNDLTIEFIMKFILEL